MGLRGLDGSEDYYSWAKVLRLLHITTPNCLKYFALYSQLYADFRRKVLCIHFITHSLVERLSLEFRQRVAGRLEVLS